MERRETPEAYADRRAQETGRTYVVTALGHAYMWLGNERLAEDCGTTVVYVARPKGRG